MDKPYDSSWDKDENGDTFDRKFKEWEQRDWMAWLQKNLSFPFTVERVEYEDDAYFTDVAGSEPFRLGHKMKVLTLADEDDLYGVIVKVREGRKVGHVPLCDVEVTSKSDKNYWPVREYVVWFANR